MRGNFGDLKVAVVSIARKFQDMENTPENQKALQEAVNELLMEQAGISYVVDGQLQEIMDIKTKRVSPDHIEVYVHWGVPIPRHQNYKEVKNYIHNTIGFNQESFQSIIGMEVQKMFFKMQEDGSFQEMIQKEIQKYLGSYRAGIPHNNYNQPSRLKELINQHVAEIVAKSFDVSVTIKKDGE